MTTTQRILVMTTVTLAISVAVYEWHRASEMEREIRARREQHASSTGQIERLQRERDELSNRAAFLADESDSLKDDAAQLSRLREEVAQSNAAVQADATQTAAQWWLGRVAQLKQRMEQTPTAQIPELQFVTEQDWLDAAKRELKTEADYRRALSAIRAAGEGKVVEQFQKALKKYVEANDEQFPKDLSQLQPYFDSPMDDAILQRWEIVPAKTVENIHLGGDAILTQKAPVDDVFDMRFVIGQEGNTGRVDFFWLENGESPKSVYEAYGAAHNGQGPDDVTQLKPYVTTPEQRAALEKLILRHSTSK
jgi:hypothetical protein